MPCERCFLYIFLRLLPAITSPAVVELFEAFYFLIWFWSCWCLCWMVFSRCKRFCLWRTCVTILKFREAGGLGVNSVSSRSIVPLIGPLNETDESFFVNALNDCKIFFGIDFSTQRLRVTRHELAVDVQGFAIHDEPGGR